jgi:hypothetical protein
MVGTGRFELPSPRTPSDDFEWRRVSPWTLEGMIQAAYVLFPFDYAATILGASLSATLHHSDLNASVYASLNLSHPLRPSIFASHGTTWFVKGGERGGNRTFNLLIKSCNATRIQQLARIVTTYPQVRPCAVFWHWK